MTGTETQDTSFLTTFQKDLNTFLDGSALWGDRSDSYAQTSTVASVPSTGESLQYGCATETMTLEEIFPELNWIGYP